MRLKSIFLTSFLLITSSCFQDVVTPKGEDATIKRDVIRDVEVRSVDQSHDDVSLDVQPELRPELTGLTLSTAVPLIPSFAANELTYNVGVSLLVNEITVTPNALNPNAMIEVDNTPVVSGESSPPITLSLGANVIEVVVSLPETSQTYELIITRGDTVIEQLAYLKSSNTDENDRFGQSIAVFGNTLVVGTPNESSNAIGIGGDDTNNGANKSGAVYVFRRTSGKWLQEAYIKASNAGSNDKFGESVAVFGDTLAVGAPDEASNATGIGGNQNNESMAESGAVYVFQRTGSMWKQQAYIKASNTDPGDRFGESVTLANDTLAVGASFESSKGITGTPDDNSAVGAGAVYVFRRTDSTWVQEARIKAIIADGGDRFGTSIVLSKNTLAVGAPGEASSSVGVGRNQLDNNASHSGAVYVFQRTDRIWMQEAYVKASNTDPGDRFGESVALFEDTLAVGAPGERNNATGIDRNQDNDSVEGAGAVYVFQRTNNRWAQKSYIKASNTDERDWFGTSVLLFGDILAVGAIGEGSNAIGLGGPQNDNSAGDSGAVYIFERTPATWVQRNYIKASNTDRYDSFGENIALSGDVLAVSASRESSNGTGIESNQNDNSAEQSGSVYIFQ